MAQRVILDTDPGIDDALAILLALAAPELDLAAVGVTGGNCPRDVGVRNALAVIEIARATTPICPGIALPLLRPPYTAEETHGATGLGYAVLPPPTIAPASEHAVDMIIREIMAAPGEVTLVAVAPLTNIAAALRREPLIAQAVRETIIMGGALRVDGNTTSLAEFNFYVDPHAAEIVLQSGMPITLVPWDITRDVLLRQAHVDRLLQRDGPLARFVAEATRFYMQFHLDAFGYAGCSINDPVALALVYMPELAITTPMHIAIEHSSELTMGKSVIAYVGQDIRAPMPDDIPGFDTHAQPPAWRKAFRPLPNTRVVTEFDGERFLHHFVERMEMLHDRLTAVGQSAAGS